MTVVTPTVRTSLKRTAFWSIGTVVAVLIAAVVLFAAARFTGPLIDAADLVMETSKVKHPMDAGQKGQKGIEW